jgi:hypothetical protein
MNGTTTNFAGNPYSLNSEGYTMPGVNFFAAGIYMMAANYSGDPSFKPSASPTVGFAITKAPTNITLNITTCPSSGQCIQAAGSQVDIFATVVTNASLFVTQPTGTMTFYSNGMPIGSPVPIDPGIVPRFASLGTTQLPLGLDNITAQYSGDTNFMASASPAGLIDMGGTFAMTANPTVISVASPGQSGSTVITFAAQNGFTGSATLSLSVCSSLPPQSTCSFNPTTVAFTSSTATVPVTLTITTSGTNSVALFTPRLPLGLLPIGGIVVGCLMGAVLIGRGGQSFRRRLAIVLPLALFATTVSCGGGASGGSGSGGGGSGGTPAQNYPGLTVTVTINGITQSINNLSVDVQ